MGCAGPWEMSRVCTDTTAKTEVHKLAHWFHYLIHQTIPEERHMLKHFSFARYKAQIVRQTKLSRKTASFNGSKMEIAPFYPK